MTSSHPDLPPCQWSSRPGRQPRPQVHPQAGPALPRRGPGPRAEDRHQLDPGRRAERSVPPLLHDGRGRRQEGRQIAARLVCEVVKPLVAGQARLTLAIDDTPTRRYGPFVQGAGIHHNPTPGPAGSPHVYGHVWVVLGLLAVHPAWGVIALPLLARMYVRAKDLPGIARSIGPSSGPSWRWPSSCCVGPITWLEYLGKPLWVVADGAYAKAPFLRPAMSLGMTVVSRLRKDAALWTVPGRRAPGRRGQAADLRRRGGSSWPSGAGQRRGWMTGAFELYGKRAKKRYKTFVATWRPAGGVIRVVLVDEPQGWVAFFCTDADASAGRDPRDGGGSVRAGDDVPRLQGGRRGRASSRCASCGRTSVHSTSASGRSR